MNKLTIDFVSDVACPWCAVGLGNLLAAIDRVKDVAQVEVRMQPFELNPDMPAGGQNTVERLMEKYGHDRERILATRQAIRERAAAVDMPLRMGEDDRSYNTFDAHRLLHWAGQQGAAQQLALKKQLLKTYHYDNLDTADTEVLVQAAAAAGLPAEQARAVLQDGQYVDEVRSEEQKWLELGISSVPSIIINDEYLISGGQPVEVFEQSLRQAATESPA